MALPAPNTWLEFRLFQRAAGALARDPDKPSERAPNMEFISQASPRGAVLSRAPLDLHLLLLHVHGLEPDTLVQNSDSVTLNRHYRTQPKKKKKNREQKRTEENRGPVRNR